MSAGRSCVRIRNVIGCLSAIGCCLLFAGRGSSVAVADPGEFDASQVKGALACRKCHESEYSAWTMSTHYRNHERITSSAGQKYAKEYGGTEKCLTCHSTPHSADAQFEGPVGVSCESCHMPAGGEDGWFDLHSDYGGEGLKREDEAADHLSARLQGCEQAGMIRAASAYALARNCYSCHIVADEKLLAAGHKPGHSDFDLIPWMQGEVRHNFQADQKTNAESPSLLLARDGIDAAQRRRVMLVVGRIVELEVCLRNLAAIDAGNLKQRYAGRRGWAGRAEDAFEALSEEIAEAVDNPNVDAAVAAVEGITLGRKFKDQQAALAAADQLQMAARLLIAEQAEVDLAGLDELVEDLDKPQGKTWQP